MVRISWTKLAVEDLKNIATYIARNSKQYAKVQITRLKSRTLILKQNPYGGRPVPEFNNNKFRELVEGNYRIIYKVVNES